MTVKFSEREKVGLVKRLITRRISLKAKHDEPDRKRLISRQSGINHQ